MSGWMNVNAGEFTPNFSVPTPQYNPNAVLYYYPQNNMYYDDAQQQYFGVEAVAGHDPAKIMVFDGYQWLTQLQMQQQQQMMMGGGMPATYYQEEDKYREEEEEEDDGTIDFSSFQKLSKKEQDKYGPVQGPKKPTQSNPQTTKPEPAQPRPAPKEAKPKPPEVLKKVDKDKLLHKVISTAPSGAEATIFEPDIGRSPVNIVFIGHVDAGKSTICGNILLLTGRIDGRLVDQYTEEARAKGRDSWWLAYIMDESEEERAKGKTIEVGRAYFNTPNKRFTILDAPGHKSYVPNMIGGASQADFAALVVSARKGEFETGFDRGGQTREHLLLSRSLGVNSLVIVVNKMDDESVQWSEDRYLQIRTELSPFLAEACKFDLTTDVTWVPISGLRGSNILHREEDPRAAWYTGPTLLEILDMTPVPPRFEDAPLRVPIIDKTRDQGVIAYGKLEAGKCIKGLKVLIMPNNIKGDILEIQGADEQEFFYANPGENVKLKLRLAEDLEIQKGHVICDVHDTCHVSSEFKAVVDFLELLENKPLITQGYSCILHIHTAVEECEITEVHGVIDVERKKKLNTKFGKSFQRVHVSIRTSNPICVENYKDVAQLGRFTLRDEGKTIGLGRVMEQITRKVVDPTDPLGSN